MEYKPPIKKPKLPPYQGIAAYTSLFETTPPPPIPEFENAKDRNVRLKIDLMKANEEKNELLLADWDPKRNFKATEYERRYSFYDVINLLLFILQKSLSYSVCR